MHEFENWLRQERSFVLEHRGLKHPFFEKLSRFSSNRDFLRIAFRQLYHIVLGFPFHIAGAIANSRDEDLLRFLVHNLYAEVGGEGGDMHIDLYRRLLRAVALNTNRPTPEEIWNETARVEDLCDELYRSYDPAEKLGALFAFEVMSSPMVSEWDAALRSSSDLAAHDFAFFTMHIDIELDHADDIARCCKRYLAGPDFASNFRISATKIMDSLEHLWNRMELAGDHLCEEPTPPVPVQGSFPH